MTNFSMRRILSEVGVPVSIAYALVAVQGLTDQSVASRLGTGDVAALAYANRLFLLPIGFVIAAFGPMVLGTLTVARDDTPTSVAETAAAQLRLIARVLAPISIAFVAIAPFLVTALFNYGAFTANSVERTVAAVDGYAVGLSATSISLLFFRAMQAVAPLRMLVLIAGGAALLNAGLCIAFSFWLGLYGITLATSIVAGLTVVGQVVVLGAALGPEWTKEVLGSSVLMVMVACLISGGLVAAEHADLVSTEARLAIGLVATLAGISLLAIRRTAKL